MVDKNEINKIAERAREKLMTNINRYKTANNGYFSMYEIFFWIWDLNQRPAAYQRRSNPKLVYISFGSNELNY